MQSNDDVIYRGSLAVRQSAVQVVTGQCPSEIFSVASLEGLPVLQYADGLNVIDFVKQTHFYRQL